MQVRGGGITNLEQSPYFLHVNRGVPDEAVGAIRHTFLLTAVTFFGMQHAVTNKKFLHSGMRLDGDTLDTLAFNQTPH